MIGKTRKKTDENIFYYNFSHTRKNYYVQLKYVSLWSLQRDAIIMFFSAFPLFFHEKTTSISFRMCILWGWSVARVERKFHDISRKSEVIKFKKKSHVFKVLHGNTFIDQDYQLMQYLWNIINNYEKLWKIMQKIYINTFCWCSIFANLYCINIQSKDRIKKYLSEKPYENRIYKLTKIIPDSVSLHVTQICM